MRARHLIVALMFIVAIPGGASPDEAWFNPPGGDWVPEQAVVAAMKADLDANISVLKKYVDLQKRPAKYWFQYQGKGLGPNRSIEFNGHLYPISPEAEKSFIDMWIPENCVISAIYLPKERKFTYLVLGGIKCPARI